MRPTLLDPPGELTDDLLCNVVLPLVCVSLPMERAARLTELERLLAYDWAMREHLRASDNVIRRRERPSFLEGY